MPAKKFALEKIDTYSVEELEKFRTQKEKELKSARKVQREMFTDLQAISSAIQTKLLESHRVRDMEELGNMLD